MIAKTKKKQPALVAIAMALSISSLAADETTPKSPPQELLKAIPIGSDLQLMADRTLSGSFSGTASLRLGQPLLKETVIESDTPVDGRAFFISAIYQHEGKYHMLYRGSARTKDGRLGGVYLCLATSEDGIKWQKPNLGLVEHEGNKNNNLVAYEDGKKVGWSFGFYDPRPGIPANERVKAFSMRTPPGEKFLRPFIIGSADGRVWHNVDVKPDLECHWPNAFDAGTLFWSEAEKAFVAYFRFWENKPGEAPQPPQPVDDWMIRGPGVRSVFRATSPDLIKWTKPEKMDFGNTAREHIYECNTAPYFRSPNVYISLANRLNPGQRAMTLEEERKANLLKETTSYITTPTYTFASDANDVVLMVSKPGSLTYDRPFMEALLRPGVEVQNWSSRNNYPNRFGGVIQTSPTEMSFFVTRHHMQNTNHIQRVAMRLDGFASVNAGYNGGEYITKPFTYKGDHLNVNFSTSGVGSIRVEIQEAHLDQPQLYGRPLPGFTLEDSDPLIGDRIQQTVSWHGKQSLAQYVGKSIRLRFKLVDADLYSFQFSDPVASEAGK
jgi:hypothetical protein